MKRGNFLFLIILMVAIPACNNNNKTTGSAKHIASRNCPRPDDMAAIYPIARSAIDNHDNDQIWNLSEIDTTDLFYSEDYYTSPSVKSRLVVINGSAGLSAGSAHRLLLLFSCPDSFKLLWAAQVGDINPKWIFDLNGDGIKEIVETTAATWMGECTQAYMIYNFKDARKNVLFNAVSNSVLQCGRENLGQLYKRGDTLETHFDCLLVRTIDKNYGVRQIRTFKMHNGGDSDEEILKNLKVNADTGISSLSYTPQLF